MPDYAQNPQTQRSSSSSYLSSFIRWLQLKKYQYEVTFSLYMLTSTEKMIFNFILFVLITLLVTAASLYLPNHIAVIYNRIWYYVSGEFAYANGGGAGDALKSTRLVESTVRAAVESAGKMKEL